MAASRSSPVLHADGARCSEHRPRSPHRGSRRHSVCLLRCSGRCWMPGFRRKRSAPGVGDGAGHRVCLVPGNLLFRGQPQSCRRTNRGRPMPRSATVQTGASGRLEPARAFTRMQQRNGEAPSPRPTPNRVAAHKTPLRERQQRPAAIRRRSRAETEAPYDSEDVLQGLLARFPDLLAGDQFAGGEAQRWVLIDRESRVPDEEGGVGRWSLDHLFLCPQKCTTAGPASTLRRAGSRSSRPQMVRSCRRVVASAS